MCLCVRACVRVYAWPYQRTPNHFRNESGKGPVAGGEVRTFCLTDPPATQSCCGTWPPAARRLPGSRTTGPTRPWRSLCSSTGCRTAPRWWRHRSTPRSSPAPPSGGSADTRSGCRPVEPANSHGLHILLYIHTKDWQRQRQPKKNYLQIPKFSATAYLGSLFLLTERGWKHSSHNILKIQGD